MILKPGAMAVALAFSYLPTAMAQQAPSGEIHTVYVTGSNLKRTNNEAPSPVQVITSKDIKDSGAATVAELLKQVPALSGNGNFDSNENNFATGVSTASLRGLSSTSTLILLNGRRMTPAAYADPNNGNSTLYDLNSIPLSALERVEVLKDGASAVYGSDAIGGVINFITKTNYQGGQISAHTGANDDGNFKRSGINAFYGVGDIDTDGYNVFVTADVTKRDRVKRSDAKDIEWEKYRFLNGRYATPYGSTISSHPTFYRETAPGSNFFSATQKNAATNLVTRPDCDPSQQLVGSTAMGLAKTSVWIGRTFCNFDTTPYREAMGDGKDSSVMSRGVLKLGQNTRAFAEVAYSRSERDFTGAPSAISISPVTNFTSAGIGVPYQTVLPIGHPDNPFKDSRASVAYRFENLRGGSRNINDNTRLLVGVEGTLGTWNWESGVLWNQAKRKDTNFGMMYLPTLRKLNAGTSLAELSKDPTLGRDVSNDNRASILQWDGKVSTEFGQLGGGAMGLAIGAEVRREKIKLRPDDVLSRGDIYGLVNSIIDGERDVKSAFVELRTPFLKNFEMDFAGRLDKYPGIKTNFVPKVGAKWTLNDKVALRSTFSKGFRAPALVQVTPGGAQFFQSEIWDPRRCELDRTTPKPGAVDADCSKSAAGTGGANPDLVPEKSKSYSLGLILSPTSNIDLLFDAYQISKKGEVALGSTDEALANEATNPAGVVRESSPLTWVKDANGNPVPNSGPLLMVRLPWKNQASVEVQGMDIEVRHRLNMGEWGALRSAVNASYMHSYRIVQSEGDAAHNLVGSIARRRDQHVDSDLALPRWKSSFTTTWSKGDHTVNASVNFVGPVSLLRVYDGKTKYDQPFCHFGTAKPTDAAPDRDTSVPNYEAHFPKCSINSWTTVGLGYTYTGIKNLTLNFNIQNLFDKAAPYDPKEGTSVGAPLTGYNESLHNNYGRYFKVSASYNF
ncbi:TonB-dependent receptor [Massilia sp. BJB1822]|uniref:TonB-dependent receptor n=1 Tax=Massilia sp. BJB1822 TaxID=2744470 RepID=UPI001592B4C2|nr:TonB-dependent receptor [Massilia sp. BJB1822]NVD99705.1 TonB-dependent receptor [Massilia sp. BJB1822]